MAVDKSFRIGAVAFDVVRDDPVSVSFFLYQLQATDSFAALHFAITDGAWRFAGVRIYAPNPARLQTIANAVGRYTAEPLTAPAACAAALEAGRARRVVWDPRVSAFVEVSELAKAKQVPYTYVLEGETIDGTAGYVDAKATEQATKRIKAKLLEHEEYQALAAWEANGYAVARLEKDPPAVPTYGELFALPEGEEATDA